MIESVGAGSQQVNPNEDVANQASISQDDFLDILLTQLTFQDPLKPLDNQEFVAQMAQFTNLEQTRQLNENSETLLTMQSASQSIGLIGREVTAVTNTGQQTGIVTAIDFNQGVPEMTLQIPNPNTTDFNFIRNIRLADIQSITN